MAFGNFAVTGTGTLSLPSVTAGATILIWPASSNGNATAFTATDSVQGALTARGSLFGTAGDSNSRLFVLTNANSGTHSITCTATGDTMLGICGAWWTGVGDVDNSGAAVNQTQGSSGTGANAYSSGNCTPVTNGCTIVGWAWNILTGTVPSAGTSPIAYTSRATTTLGGTPFRIEDFSQTTAAAIAATFGMTAATNVARQVVALAPSSTNITVNLTGQRITSGAGTLTPSSTLTLTGSRATSGQGSVGIQNGRTLTGQRITSGAGLLSNTRAIGLSGLRATFSAGTITASTGGNVTVSLTGARITSVAGNLTAARSLPLTGSRVTSASGTLVAGKSMGLSGLRMTANAGNLSDTRSLGLTGLRINSAAGTITASQSSPNVTVSLNGARITSRQGVITASGGTGGSNLPPTVGFICNVATLDNHHA